MTQPDTEEFYMKRSIELARKGAGHVAPNPLVGAVIVHGQTIIGEGYHREYGKAHAEVNAINAVADKNLLCESTLYVTLEPCSHVGKTPACSDLIIAHKIPRVVIGMQDPFGKVNGEGIRRLMSAGCQVKVGVLEEECSDLNKAFITFHQKKRPYIILKWAQSKDGFLDKTRLANDQIPPAWITNETRRALVHKWRSEIPAILVGKNTALMDNPKLNLRAWTGKAPLRIVADKNLELPANLHLFDRTQPTWVLNQIKSERHENLEYIQLDFGNQFFVHLMKLLTYREINALLVEGGRKLLQSFIDANFWDEARVFSGNQLFENGISAPAFNGTMQSQEHFGNSTLTLWEPLC